MDLKVKVADIVAMKNGIDSIIKNNSLMPGALAYKIALLQRLIQSHYGPFEEQRNELVMKYGHEHKDNPGAWSVDLKIDGAEKFGEYIDRVSELLDVDVEVSGISAISLEELSRVELPLDAVHALFPIIEGGEQELTDV